MSFSEIAEICYAVTGTSAVISGLLVWVHRRGGAEKEVALRLQENSASNEKLTQAVDVLNEQLIAGFEKVHDRINAHDTALALIQRDISYLNGQLAGHQ